MEALLLMCSLQEEVSSIKESFATLEDSSSLSLSRSLAASLLLVSMGQPLLQKLKEEEKQAVVKEEVKEDIVMGDQQDFQSKYPRLAASFESMDGMSTMYPNGTSFLKEKMSLIATDTAKVLEKKWKKLEDDEAALMVKRLDLIAEHYKLVVDAMRGN